MFLSQHIVFICIIALDETKYSVYFSDIDIISDKKTEQSVQILFTPCIHFRLTITSVFRVSVPKIFASEQRDCFA